MHVCIERGLAHHAQNLAPVFMASVQLHRKSDHFHDPQLKSTREFFMVNSIYALWALLWLLSYQLAILLI